MNWLFVLLFLWIYATDKETFLAAVEGFSPRGLARPWDHSNNERTTNDARTKRQGSSLIRFYVKEKLETNAKEEDEEGGSTTGMNNSTIHAEDSVLSSPATEEQYSESTAHVFSSEIAASTTPSSSIASTIISSSSSGHPVSHGNLDHLSPPSVQKPRKPTVRSCLPDLFAMTRPSNLPGVILFHMLGTYLAIHNTGATSSYWRILLSPSMMMTLMALLLTSSTSMLVNDYYDFKLGHDSTKPFQPLNTPSRLPLDVLKRFLSYLYAAALVTVTMVPGVPARMAVVMGLMLTFWYTQHLKPRTWLKNAVCASLIALSPLTSGVGAMSFTGTTGEWGPLLRVVSMLFVGILGREITMDIKDVQDDSNHGVRTVPVVYGPKVASAIGFVCAIGVAGLALVGPISQFSLGNFNVRQWILAVVGGAAQLRRGWQVFQTEGQNTDLVHKAVQEGLVTVILLLASFV